MEARQTLRGSGVPKGLVIVLAACAAFGVALAGSVIAKDFTGSSSATTSAVHPAPGTVLRQDNPANDGMSTFHAAPGTILRQDYPANVAAPLLDRGADRGSNAPAAAQPGSSHLNQAIDGPDGGYFTS
jgi:hypothetical protein